MNRAGLRDQNGSIIGQVVKQSAQAFAGVVVLGVKSFADTLLGLVNAISVVRLPLQLEAIHGVADADANQVFKDIRTTTDIPAPDVIVREEDSCISEPMCLPTGIHGVAYADASQVFKDSCTTGISAPDVIVQEDGSCSAEPMHLPKGSIYTYTAQQLETSSSTDHPLSEFEDGAFCIEPKPGSDDYFSVKELPFLTKITIMDPIAIVPICEDPLKEDSGHTNAVIDVAWKCKLFEESKGKWAVKAISEKYDQGKSVEAKIALPESIRNLRLEDTCA